MNKKIVFLFICFLAIVSLYKIIPYESRPAWLGAPHLAIAVFAGAVVANRKWAFALPLLCLLMSDLIMQVLHTANPAAFQPGFYPDLIWNYVIITGLVAIGFLVKPSKWTSVAGGLIAAPLVFFLLSNFVVWIYQTGFARGLTLQGLMMTYVDGVPFIKATMIGSLLFGGLLFATWALVSRPQIKLAKA